MGSDNRIFAEFKRDFDVKMHMLTQIPEALSILRPVLLDKKSDGQGRGVTFIFCVPHSGRYYPDAFVKSARLNELALRGSEDAYVDQLIDFDNISDVYGLRMNYARAYIDVNRDEAELDPKLISGRLPALNLSATPRVVSGFGVVARCIKPGLDIYRSPLTLAEVRGRIDRIYAPYHRALKGLIAEAKTQSARIIVFDWHSMPSQSKLNRTHLTKKMKGADIVIGDLHGDSCRGETRRIVKNAFEAQGFSVGLNDPFSGGHTTQSYANSHAGIETIQIEINRGLYMDEETIEPLSCFETVASRMHKAIEMIKTGVI